MAKHFLKLKRPHKSGFRLGRHLVVMGSPQEYSLNKAEEKELKGKGPQAWIKSFSKEEMDAMPKSNEENAKRQNLINPLRDRGIEIKGTESIEQLQEMKDNADMRDELVKTLLDAGMELEGNESMEELELAYQGLIENNTNKE